MEAKNKELVQRYVSLLTNSGFKAVFGDRRNKDVVMSVINMLLPEGKQVRDIEYAPTEHQGPMLVSKEFQYDFMCKGTDGTAFIVEMQAIRKISGSDGVSVMRVAHMTCRTDRGKSMTSLLSI